MNKSVATATNRLTVDDLHLHYGDNVILKGVSLVLEPGEVVALLGASGSGKTTLLRSVAGLEQPSGGRIAIGNSVLFDAAKRIDLPVEKRNLGLVFQSYALWPHRSVFDNVAYGLRNRGLSRDQLHSRVDEALNLVELTGFERRYRHQLSGGQQQRVALARAVAYQPDVLLLDEPFSNLDAKLRKSMRLQVRKLQQRLRLTTVFVTHDQQEALSLSDVVAVINNGEVEQVGSPAEVYQQPRSEFVADFIGSTNLLPGVVRGYDAGRGAAVVVVEGGTSIEVAHERPVGEGTHVKVLCKPEQLRLDPAGELRGTLSAAAYLGSVVQYQVEVGSTSIEVVMPASGELYAVGARVGLDVSGQVLRLIEA